MLLVFYFGFFSMSPLSLFFWLLFPKHCKTCSSGCFKIWILNEVPSRDLSANKDPFGTMFHNFADQKLVILRFPELIFLWRVAKSDIVHVTLSTLFSCSSTTLNSDVNLFCNVFPTQQLINFLKVLEFLVFLEVRQFLYFQTPLWGWIWCLFCLHFYYKYFYFFHRLTFFNRKSTFFHVLVCFWMIFFEI